MTGPDSGPVIAGRRPNTVLPTTFLTVTSEQLLGMTDLELIQFADQVLSIAIPQGTSRTKILTRIVNASLAARDGL